MGLAGLAWLFGVAAQDLMRGCCAAGVAWVAGSARSGRGSAGNPAGRGRSYACPQKAPEIAPIFGQKDAQPPPRTYTRPLHDRSGSHFW